MPRANATVTGSPMPLDRWKDAGKIAAGEYSIEGGAGGPVEIEEASGTSIFDPVLCELVYRWFSPPGAMVLDPFAGGSVRGIVAHRLGRGYVGHELRDVQVQANREQAAKICAAAPAPARRERPATMRVRISSKMANLRFNGCDPEYIASTCHASCCQSSTAPGGTIISILPHEVAAIEARGGEVRGGLLQSVAKRCPFKTAPPEDLCGLHFTPDKPFGCIASPFTLNDSDTLIVRNRYRLLKCYDDGAKLPAYVAFRASLDLLFGKEEAARICEHLAAGGGDLYAEMSTQHRDWLHANDETKKGEGAGALPMEAPDLSGPTPLPRWICGDSREIDKTCAEVDADLIFSCPPYADLERYSDDPADLSTMSYPEFKAAYFEIIRKACARLRPDSFACFVVGEVRDKKGNYRDFIGDTVQAFRDAGLAYYNEAILITAAGSLPIRAGKQFSAGRKLGKTHQNVLVFVKGDGARAARRCGPVEFEAGLLDEPAAEESAP